MDVEEALALARPLVDRDTVLVGYWQVDEAFVFDISPVPLSDSILVVEHGQASWLPYGPLHPGGNRFGKALAGDSRPLP